MSALTLVGRYISPYKAWVGLLLAMTAPFLLNLNSALWVMDDVLDWMQDNELGTNPFLMGNFAPVAEERRGLEMEVVFGVLPEDLDGMIVRNGPNPIPEQLSKRYLWFDGHGMLHNVRIRDGKALYSNTYLRTPRYEYEAKHGFEYFLRLGELDGVVGILKLVLNSLKCNLLGISMEESGQGGTCSKTTFPCFAAAFFLKFPLQKCSKLFSNEMALPLATYRPTHIQSCSIIDSTPSMRKACRSR